MRNHSTRRRPFPRGLGGAALSRTAGLTGALFLGYTGVMVGLERTMRASGGPGIIPFELAGAQRAQNILSAWGPDGTRAARVSLQLDFGYMATYGLLLALLVEGRRRRSALPPAVGALAAASAPLAVATDAIEGVALLRVLSGRDVERSADVARRAALTKFAAIGAALAYVAAAR